VSGADGGLELVKGLRGNHKEFLVSGFQLKNTELSNSSRLRWLHAKQHLLYVIYYQRKRQGGLADTSG
jgi:hypothetical protein